MYSCVARQKFKNAINESQELKGQPLDQAEMINIRLRVIMEEILELKADVERIRQKQDNER